MSKQFLAVIIAVIVVLGGIFVFSGKNQKNTSTNSHPGTLTNHVIGKGTTGVTLVEYGDYQCPFCGQYFPTVKQVQTEYGDKIKFQFRNFPLVDAHPNAFAAARAAEAAALQNKFWEMHDLLYENQDLWKDSGKPMSIFTSYAKQLGLDVNRFRTDYLSSRVNDLINADEAEGNKLKIQGTPTFFVDGKQIQINNDVKSFENVLNAEIAKKASKPQ